MTAIEPEVAGLDALEALAAEHLAGEFKILARLGPGAWGERFRARDLHRAEEVVLTLLPPIDGDEWKEEARFLEALRAASLLDHPHLAPVRAYGVSGPLRWSATLTHGDPTLAERVAETGPLSMAVVRRIAQQLASGLDQAHRRGVVHGALTVHDVRIDANGWVRLEEVGVGAALGPAPEGADQVGLAELVRYCLTGGVEDAPLPADLDAAVFAAILRATRPRPSDRFRDLLEFVAALDGVQTNAQPLKPSIPVRQRIKAADWEELIETEPAAPASTPRSRVVPVIGGVLLLILVTAAIPVGRRLMRPEEGRISYPSPALITPSAAAIAPVVPPPPPTGDDPTPAVVTPRSAPVKSPVPTPAPRPAPRRVPAPTLPPTQASTDPQGLPPVPPTQLDEVPGTLSISSTPWGELSVDGTVVGNTPQASFPLAPGHHEIRITRDGYVPFEIDILVRPGEAIRLTQLTLKELKL